MRRGIQPVWAAVVSVVALGLSSVVAQEAVYVEFRSSLRYLANAADPGIGTTWTQPGFVDTGWPGGIYGVGYETFSSSPWAGYLIKTPVPPGTSYIYTRATFLVPDVTSIQELHLGMDWDDGVVAWINGVEVFRSPGMPPGPPSWDTVSPPHESSNGVDPNYGALEDISLTGIPALTAGTNVLAIGVWNEGVASSDLVVIPQLVANPQSSVIRGPYLQKGSSTSVVVRWRTDTPQDSRVAYGESPGSLYTNVDDPQSTTEHEVELTGLDPDTKYYYAIGNTDELLVGNDERHRFITAPTPGTKKPSRIWIIGDSGTGGYRPRLVYNAYADLAGTERTDIWCMLGDNAYWTGTDQEYQTNLFEIYPELLRSVVLFPTIGNHDRYDSTTQSWPYYDSFTMPTSAEAGGVASGAEAYYSFDHANVHFVVLDSHNSNRMPDGPMLTWLEQDLAATLQDWIVAYWHHPPYSDGSHDSDTEPRMVDMRQNALPILESHGVDAVLTGHSHNYERSLLIDGHYGDSSTFGPSHLVDAGDGHPDGPTGPYEKPTGLSPHAGTVYTVAGTAASISPAALQHPAMPIGFNMLGSLVLDVDGGRLDARFLDATGVVLDHYRIIKDPCVGLGDEDEDAICDPDDNCPEDPNNDQANDDGDPAGNECDCDPAYPGTYPGAPESNDGEDNNCDGVVDETSGNSGFRNPNDTNEYS